VQKIEGCPSGTLGYLFGELGRGRRFSEALRGAIAKGYPEPDPRDDLCGMDVARKALILGRLLGFPGELEDIEVESLVPEGALGGARGHGRRRAQRRPQARQYMNERVSWQVCASCGQELAASDPRQRCPACRGLLELRHRAPPMTHGGLRALLDSRLGVRRGPLASGVWRYRELVLPEADDSLVSYPEGNTPLLARPAVAGWVGVPGLLIKHGGLRPTGSFTA